MSDIKKERGEVSYEYLEEESYAKSLVVLACGVTVSSRSISWMALICRSSFFFSPPISFRSASMGAPGRAVKGCIMSGIKRVYHKVVL